MRYIAAAALVAAMIGSNALAANQPSLLQTFQPYKLTGGVNTVPHMANGQSGTIIELRHQGDHDLNTYGVFMVALGGNVVWFDVDSDLSAIDGNQGFHDTLTAGGSADYAFRAVRFGTAIVNGKRQTVAVIANKNDIRGAPLNAPAPVKIMVWSLTHDDDFDYDYFSKVAVFQTHGKYCDANVALLREAKIALPPRSESPASANGC